MTFHVALVNFPHLLEVQLQCTEVAWTHEIIIADLKMKVYKRFCGGKHLQVLLEPGKEKSETNKTSSLIEESSPMMNYSVTYLLPGKTFS